MTSCRFEVRTLIDPGGAETSAPTPLIVAVDFASLSCLLVSLESVADCVRRIAKDEEYDEGAAVEGGLDEETVLENLDWVLRLIVG